MSHTSQFGNLSSQFDKCYQMLIKQHHWALFQQFWDPPQVPWVWGSPKSNSFLFCKGGFSGNPILWPPL